jgi:predicted PurR-regulated permease PerM
VDSHNEKPFKETEKTVKINPSHYFLFFLLFLVIYASYNILQPYLNTIILATILAIVFNPIHQKIERYVKSRKNLAAILSCILLTLVVVLPLTFMLIALIQQGAHSFNAIYEWVAAGNFKKLLDSPLIIKIIAVFDKYLPDIKKLFPDIDLKSLKIDKALLDLSSSIGKTLIDQGGHLVGNITSIIGKFFLMIFVFFFMVRDEKKIFGAILHLMPLSTSHENQVLSKIRTVARSALLGTFVTAVAQGAAGGFAFWVSGLPGLFWGMVMAFASLIPIVGTALIWVPAAGYLFLSGHWGYGIFMVLWCAIVVGMIDNFVRPLFMKGSADMSTLLIFFSILGGINYFGLIGLLYGPLIFGLAMVFLYIYSLEFETFLNHQDRT